MTRPHATLPRTVVLVSGNGSNLQAMIDAARAGELAVRFVGVLSDRPGVLALERAARAGLATEAVDFAACAGRNAFDDGIARTLERWHPDLVALAGFMRILPAGMVARYAGRMLNVHPSLLPSYPGLHTFRRALEAGEAWHGSTVHFVTPELDAGPAVLQYRVPVGPEDTEDSLRRRVQQGEYLIYPRALHWLATGRLAHRDGRVWLDGVALDAPIQVQEGARPPP